MTDKYKIKYKIDIENREEGYEPEDASNDHGLTDALLAVSIVYPEDGSYSQQIVIAFDGKEKQPMTDNDIFKLWMTMGLGLSERQDLDPWKKELLLSFRGMVRTVFNIKEKKSHELD